jgi:XTP/dITP diphosphohydrolase
VTDRTIVVATRSSHKLRELLQMLPPLPGLRFSTLEEAGVGYSPEEEEVEAFDTFEENALAKARYFQRRTGGIVLADDSGLCVDALGGAPGVRSKRFSGRDDLSGTPLDLANNERLVRSLAAAPGQPHTARYECVIAIVSPEGREDLFRGTVEGTIVARAAGESGFGYDPHFFHPPLAATFAQLAPEVKNRFSHRFDALQKAVPRLRELASGFLPPPR